MRSTFILAALLLIAVPLRAQTDTTSAPATLTGLCPGSTVRIYLTPGGPVQGRCAAVMDGRLVVRQEDGERTVPVADVSEVWTRERATEPGMWYGAAAGALTLVSAGLLVASAMCESSDCSGDYMLVIGYGTVVGGGTGALIGGTIGYLTRRWVRQYP
jgi:hypothetical protein